LATREDMAWNAMAQLNTIPKDVCPEVSNNSWEKYAHEIFDDYFMGR